MKFKLYFLLRYLFLLCLGLFGFDIIYGIFTPLTLYPSFFILKLIYPDALLSGVNQIFINGQSIRLIEACIAGAAYYFLLTLNLSTPINVKQRAKSIAFLLSVFLIANILRISLFSYLYLEGFVLFDLYHLATWYFVSTLFVVAIWFINVKLFKIKEIPIYSDFKYILNHIKR